MPIKSEKQKRLMQAASHNPEFAKKVGIKPEVAKEMLHPRKKQLDALKRPAKKES